MFDYKLVVCGFCAFHSSVTEHIMNALHEVQFIIPNINMCVSRPTVSCSARSFTVLLCGGRGRITGQDINSSRINKTILIMHIFSCNYNLIYQ